MFCDVPQDDLGDVFPQELVDEEHTGWVQLVAALAVADKAGSRSRDTLEGKGTVD